MYFYFYDLLYEVYRCAERLRKPVMTVSELKGKEPMVLRGYKKYGATKWRWWSRFTAF